MKVTRAPDQSLRCAQSFVDQICDQPHLGHHDHDATSKAQSTSAKRGDASPGKTAPAQPPAGLPKEAADIEADPDAPINFHGLAKLVKNSKTLFLIVQHYLVPDNLDPNLQPTCLWL